VEQVQLEQEAGIPVEEVVEEEDLEDQMSGTMAGEEETGKISFTEIALFLEIVSVILINFTL